MKRKQAQDAEEGQDNFAHLKTRTFIQTAPTLENIPDVLVVSILSFLDFYERSKVRRVSRRLLHSVDSMATPPDLTLEIQLVPADSLGVRPWTATWDSDIALVEMHINSRLAISDFPVVKSIRPARLHVEEPQDDEEGKVDARLIHRLATQVAKTVTKLSIVNLKASSANQLKDALVEFDKEGDGVTELHLSTCHPLMHTVSAIVCLRKLRSLYLSLNTEMVEGWRRQHDSIGLQLFSFTCLPDLQELAVHKIGHGVPVPVIDDMRCNDSTVAGHMLGCSTISTLRKLSSDLLFDWWGESQIAFATMLRRLTNLESLSILNYPRPDLWGLVHAAGGHKKLQALAIDYSEPDVKDLNSLASACNQDFPALRNLKIHFLNMDIENGEVVRALAPLKTHPSLLTVKCGWFDEDEKGTFFTDCQEALGGDNRGGGFRTLARSRLLPPIMHETMNDTRD